jgi:hypothetical protein
LVSGLSVVRLFDQAGLERIDVNHDFRAFEFGDFVVVVLVVEQQVQVLAAVDFVFVVVVEDVDFVEGEAAVEAAAMLLGRKRDRFAFFPTFSPSAIVLDYSS